MDDKHDNLTTSKGKYKPNPEDYSDWTLTELIFETVYLKGQSHTLLFDVIFNLHVHVIVSDFFVNSFIQLWWGNIKQFRTVIEHF